MTSEPIRHRPLHHVRYVVDDPAAESDRLQAVGMPSEPLRAMPGR
jgi:hypothetical protein